MLKAGIFLDIENLTRNGGWGLRYDVVKDLAAAQGTAVLRANAYLAIDVERESEDFSFRQKGEEYRNAIRKSGFHLVLKEVHRYRDSTGEIVLKANADLDLAVDALLQAENLDYILLGTGDGDFLRLIRALQGRGKRVDLLSFANTSTALRKEADYYFSGFTVPGLLPSSDSDGLRKRGFMYGVNEEKGFGFISMRTGLGVDDERDQIFCHIRDFSLDGRTVDNSYFANLKTREAIIEFDIVEQPDGRLRAKNVTEFVAKTGRLRAEVNGN